jgi:hypothetical protein
MTGGEGGVHHLCGGGTESHDEELNTEVRRGGVLQNTHPTLKDSVLLKHKGGTV